MRTYQPSTLAADVVVPPASGSEKHLKALRKWNNRRDGNTEYGATLYATVAACYETEGKIAEAEAHLIEAYKLCRSDELTDKAADIAERLYLLLWSQAKNSQENEHKAMGWKCLSERLRGKNYG